MNLHDLKPLNYSFAYEYPKPGPTNGSKWPDYAELCIHVARADHVTEEIPTRKSPISIDSEEFSRRKHLCRLVEWRISNG